MAAMSNKLQLMAAVIEQLKEEGALKEIKFSGIAEKLDISRPDTARYVFFVIFLLLLPFRS